MADSAALRWVAVEIFLSTVEGKPPTASALSRRLEMPRATLLRRLGELIEIGYVKRIGNGYVVTEKVNTPQLEKYLAQNVSDIVAAAKELSKMNENQTPT
jgi:DNA-binding IclR family transcriptional regulator